jgi:hypothetical protein
MYLEALSLRADGCVLEFQRRSDNFFLHVNNFEVFRSISCLMIFSFISSTLYFMFWSFSVVQVTLSSGQQKTYTGK